MKNFLDGLKKGIGFGLGFLLLVVTGVFAYQFTTYVDVPDSTSGGTLNSSSYNQLLANVRDLNTKMNLVYNSTTSNIKAGYQFCYKNNPTFNNIYNCDGSYNSTPGIADMVGIRCSSGYKALSGGGYTDVSGTIRETRPSDDSSAWYVSGRSSIGRVQVTCVKFE